MESKNSDEDSSEIQRKDHSEENICGVLRTGSSLHSAVVYSRLWVVPCVADPKQQESDYESRMDTYVLVLQNYGKSMENVVTVLENDVYIRKLINRNTFTWDNTAGIAAQEVTNLVSVNPMIHSVYVWLEDDYLIKSTNPSYPIDQNGDARMLWIFSR